MGVNKMCNTSVVSYLHPPPRFVDTRSICILVDFFFVSREVRVYMYIHPFFLTAMGSMLFLSIPPSMFSVVVPNPVTAICRNTRV